MCSKECMLRQWVVNYFSICASGEKPQRSRLSLFQLKMEIKRKDSAPKLFTGQLQYNRQTDSRRGALCFVCQPFLHELQAASLRASGTGCGASHFAIPYTLSLFSVA